MKTVKGTKDWMPEEAALRRGILEKIEKVFQTYGFVPLETPALESFSLLSKKEAGGPEVIKETYSFKDRSGRRIGLRYDLTVPLARVVASNPDLPLPFKRYQIGRAWRYGDVAKGRLREFWQADIDVVGSPNMLADAECIACAADALKTLGFKKFKIRINNRKILSGMAKYASIKEELECFRILDKLEKIGLNGVEKELRKKFSKDSVNKIISFLKLKSLKSVEKVLGEYGKEGVEEARILFSFLRTLGVKEVEFDISLARGLDYYTGPIYEAYLKEKSLSIAGGGRYDRLMGLYGKSAPATGISLGIERIAEIMKPKKGCKSKVFVAVAKKEVQKKALEIVQNLRKKGTAAETELMDRNLSRQLEYANKKGIPYVIIIGPEDLKKGEITLRDMKTGNERKVGIQKSLKFF